MGATMPAPKKIAVGSRDQSARARLARWINTYHGGNIAEAALALGTTYTLLYWPLKRSGRPGMRLLWALVMRTGKPADYWLGDES